MVGGKLIVQVQEMGVSRIVMLTHRDRLIPQGGQNRTILLKNSIITHLLIPDLIKLKGMNV
jgi:hypothetical protein